MGRLTTRDRDRNKSAIRAAMERLLAGDIPPGGRCDMKTPAAEAGVPRTGFYPKGDRRGPYQHLADEFTRRKAALETALQRADPREAQIARLKAVHERLRQRITAQGDELAELREFKKLAVSRLAAQHAELQRLRASEREPLRVLPSGR